MNESIIIAENISKRFVLSHQNSERYKSLRDSISDAAKSVFSKKEIKDTEEEFWALKDINFEIKKGDRVGVIGRNGAGKSTLLKLLSRITEPSTGKITIKGRVSSLLEVGTGFHPELTGRENIFLNGAILGMTRNEIKAKFDEIVDFAEIEKFLDTPVKRYSSGMYVRLAFAVAANLEPEILLVDEVLAVGDAQFQKKCLGKMDDVSKKEGRTILFVSHNIGAIKSLCNKGILLRKGELAFHGEVNETINLYENSEDIKQEGVWLNTEEDKYDARFESMRITNSLNEVKTTFSNEEEIKIIINASFKKSLEYVKIGFDLIKDGVVIFRSQQIDSNGKHDFKEGVSSEFIATIPKHLLNHGTYLLRPLFSVHNVTTLLSTYDAVLKFNVELDKSDYFKMVLTEQNFPGVLFPKLNWDIK